MDETSRAVKYNRASDIIISLEPEPGKSVLTAKGMVDNRLFSGENQLHAKVDGTGLWYLQYDAGVMPKQLQQKFTSWSKLYNFVADYYKQRNIQIKEVID